MKVTLTELVDIVSKAGTPKATQVAQIKSHQGGYSPHTDFYRLLRSCIVSTHKNDGKKADLDQVLEKTNSEIRLQSYPDLIAAYKKWWGRKDLGWFIPPSAIHSGNGVSVSINPELGLIINGVPHVIKLYFKADPLKKTSADLINGLMSFTLKDSAVSECQFAVLDVRNVKLHVCTESKIPAALAMVNAELAYVAEIWANVGKAA